MCPGNQVVLIPHPHNCRDYFLCVGNKAHWLSCKSGYYFDRSTSSCRIVDKCLRDFECPEIDDTQYKVKFASPNFCEYYYQCLHGYINFMKCDFGQRYNSESQECENI